eukprot:7234977-Prymnesium_polylepis.1
MHESPKDRTAARDFNPAMRPQARRQSTYHRIFRPGLLREWRDGRTPVSARARPHASSFVFTKSKTQEASVVLIPREYSVLA